VSKVTLAVRNLGERLEAIKESAKGKIYGYLHVNSTGLPDDDIEEAFIEFRVNKSWIEDNGINKSTVRLQRYHDGQWEELETEMVASEGGPPTGSFIARIFGFFTGLFTGFATADDGYYHYRAKTPGFSYFAITGEENIENAGSLPGGENASIDQKPPANETGGGKVSDGPSYGFIAALAAVAAIVIAAAGAVAYKKGAKKPKTLDDALGNGGD
jgi:hypothetical protein